MEERQTRLAFIILFSPTEAATGSKSGAAVQEQAQRIVVQLLDVVLALGGRTRSGPKLHHGVAVQSETEPAGRRERVSDVGARLRRQSRDTDLKSGPTLTSDPLLPSTRYCCLVWTSTLLQVAFFTRSTWVPGVTASKPAGTEEPGCVNPDPRSVSDVTPLGLRLTFLRLQGLIYGGRVGHEVSFCC